MHKWKYKSKWRWHLFKLRLNYEFQDYPYIDCNYVASCIEELDFFKENTNDDDGPSELVLSYNCNIFGIRNTNKGELIIHLKTISPETARTCKFIIYGKFVVFAGLCKKSQARPSSPQTLREYMCGLREKIVQHKTDFMHQRNEDHEQLIPDCRDYMNGSCRFERISFMF